MTEIYLIRHAQAEGNLYRMMQGHWDGKVTELGWKQIDALAERFRDIHIDAVYSSDLYRTRMTAGAITRYHDIPLHTTAKLREINMGAWEAEFFANVNYSQPEDVRKFIFEPSEWKIPGAETYAQVAERAFPELERLCRKHPGQVIAAVSHGVTIRCILSKALGIDLKDVEQLPIVKNTAVTKLYYDKGSFSAEYINDYSHLDAVGGTAWSNTEEIRDENFDPASDAEYYKRCYADSWKVAHGNLDGFCADLYLDAAISHYRANPSAVKKLYIKEELVGLVDLDPERSAHMGCGWVTLLYLKDEYREKGLGIQVLARAISLYSKLGRSCIRLNVHEDNRSAVDFYEKHGFKELSREGGLLLMEMKLGGK